MSDQAPDYGAPAPGAYTPDQAHAEVREGLQQHADDTRAQQSAPAPGQSEELGARLAAGGAGTTDVDATRLLEIIQAMQGRLDALEAEKRDSQAPPLLATVQSLRDLLGQHASMTTASIDHTDVLGMAEDLADAAKNAVQSGDLSHVAQIGQKIRRWLDRHHPGPGENAHYNQARDFAGPHLEDAIASFEGPERSTAPAVTSSRPPARVIPGNVTG